MAEKTFPVTIKLKRTTAANWPNDYLLQAGEPGLESDTGKIKIGDGVTIWGNLDYIITEDIITSKINTAFDNLTPNDINAVPETRKINDKALSSDIELYANNIELNSHDSTTVATAIAAIPTLTSDLTNDSNFITSNDLPTNLSDLTNDLNYDNAPTINSTNNITSGAVYNSIDNVIQVANGKTACYVFDTIANMTNWVSESSNKAKLKTGDVFLIRAIDVPDYWWDGTANNGAGDIYQLETTKVDLTNYVQKSGSKELSDNNYTDADQTKLSNLANITSIGAGLNLLNGELSNNKIYAADIAMSGSDATKISAKIANLTAADVGALPSSTTLSTLGGVPTTRTINDKALSSNIRLTANDVGALSSSTNLTTLGGLPKPSSTTSGHYATWDSNGNIVDSGYKIVVSSSAPTVNDTSIITIVK